MSNDELKTVKALLKECHFDLDEIQPHISGERFLMQALTTVNGQKYILKGTYKNQSVIIKVTRDEQGKNEINHERTCRQMLNQLKFAYDVFAVPEEVYHETIADYLVNAQLFIPQDKTFLERPLLEQFDFTIKAFGATERSRATTNKHIASITNIFGVYSLDNYLDNFTTFIATPQLNETSKKILTSAYQIFNDKQVFVNQYNNFLTHTDFVPHNFRINNNRLYLLDFSAIRFGNKHEGWARFLNFMTLYNPDLEAACLTYFKNNRAAEENESLYLMRLYRLAELVIYYQKTLSRSHEELLSLNTARVVFWSDLLEATLNHSTISPGRRQEYIELRDRLRTPEEKLRQQGLH